MNKYKFVSLVLTVALLATLVRLVFQLEAQPDAQPINRAEVVFQNILARKSVRSFTDEPVRRSQLDTLLRAAMAAPTGRDMRPWKFIVLDERATMDTLAAQLPYAQMLKEAPAAILVCGDLSIKGKDGKPSGNWTFDCSAASENLLLAAEALGLGAVWTGVHPYEDRVQAVRTALQLPDYIVPLNLIPIGHPKGKPKPKDKYNADNIHFNGW